MPKEDQDRKTALGRAALLAYGLAAAAMLFWAGNWVVVRAARSEVPPVGLNFWRWLVAALVLLPFVWGTVRRDWPAARKNWRVLLGLAATGAAVFHTMINVGLRSTEAINALLLNAAAPVIIIVMAWAVFRDTVTRRQIVGIAISLAGAVVLVSRGEPTALTELRFNTGDLWVLAALFVWSAYSILLKRRPPEIDGGSLLFYMCVIAVILMAPVYAWETAAGRPVAFNLPALATIAYTALFASVAGLLCYNAAIARIGPGTTGFFFHLMPVFGSALAILFLGEELHLYHLAGFGVVLVGILLSTYRISYG